MQTRRRLHPSITLTTQEESSPLINFQQQPQHHQLQQQQQHNQQLHHNQQSHQNLLFAGALSGAGTLPHTSDTSAILIGDAVEQNHQQQQQLSNHNNSQQPPIDTDDKYGKAQRQWNLRSLSTKLQATSGQALKTFIQQPLSAAAAVVTGNYPLEQSNNNNYNYNNSSSYNSYTTGRQQNQQQQQQFEEDDLEFEKEEELIVMASRDRTGEFASAIRSLQSRNITRAVTIGDPKKVKQIQSYSEFMMVSKFIGKNIASTFAKLEKLTLLAKKKTLFDDRPQEIQELTYIIKGDLSALNQQIARLQEISKDQRRSMSGKHLMSHSSSVVLALQSKLASMSTDFKQILEVRTENLRHQKTRRDQYGQGPPVSVRTIPPATAKHGSLLLSEENQQNHAVSIDMTTATGDNTTTPLLGPPARIQTQQQIALYDESDNYVQQRAETMQNIESTIVELGGIFQQLAHMVKEQEEIVERIDTNVQDAEINIEAAHGEILKYFQSVSKNRWLMIKIFGVLIFFFIFFVVFMT